MSFFCRTPLTSFLVCWKFISESQFSTVRMKWNLMVSLSALLSPLSTCWPPGHLLGASYHVNESFCTPWHWRCHFIPCLGHKASRASWMTNETIAAEPMQGSCRLESASVFSLVTSDSVTSQEPGAVWLRVLTVAENTTTHHRKLLGVARRR